MRRIAAALIVLVAGIGLALLPWTRPPARTSAGGLPCFMCHGVNFEGSDIAPRVAGTKLTDEQILNQIRHPRGLMPAYPEFAQPFVVEWIRRAPTGEPTMSLSRQERSAALVAIGMVALARATEVLQATPPESASMPTISPAPTASPRATSSPLPPTATAFPQPSTATVTPTTVAAATNTITTSAASAGPALPLGVLVVGGLVLATLGVWWRSQRRKTVSS